MAHKHISARTVTILIVALCVLFAAGAYSLGVMNMKAEVPDEKETQAEKPVEAAAGIDNGLLAVKPDDIIIGNPDAPVTIVEYASLSCSHCAHFHTKELPMLEKNVLEAGKAKLVLRHFPLNITALKGAQLVNCVPAEDKRNFIKVLFEMQSEWAFTQSYEQELKKIAAVGGISEDTFNACINDKSSEEALLAANAEATEKLRINGTPAFFIDGKVYTGTFDAEGLEKAVEAAGAK